MMILGLSPALGSAPTSSAPAAPNPNLLRWTEEFDNAVWSHIGVTVTANVDVGATGATTADRLAFSAGADVHQDSQTAVAAGANASAGFDLTDTLTRYSVTGTFDSIPYTFSVYMKGAGSTVSLFLLRSSGVLRCEIVDLLEEGPTIIVDAAKLEQAAAPSAYNHRTT